MRKIALAPLILAGFAQTRLEFEVASVKAGDPMNSGMSVHSTPGGIELRNNTLKNCILNAYRVRPWQVDGGPKWVDSAHFDINAKIPAGAKREQIPEMLQALLADRFQLQFHRETRNLSIYALVVANGGHKLRAPEDKEHSRSSAGPRKIEGFATGMSSLAGMLSGPARAPVIDRTGLAGQYDFKLEYSPEGSAAEDETFPPVFIALQQQLGLKLEATKAPIEVLVIDRAEKPSEN